MQTVVAHGRLLKSLGKTSGTLYGTERGKGPVPSRRLLENQAQKNVPVHLTAVCEEARHKHFAQAWEYKMRQNMLNSSESWFGNSKKKKITILQPVWPELWEDLPSCFLCHSRETTARWPLHHQTGWEPCAPRGREVMALGVPVGTR